jgi:hypothetical protein
MERTRRFSNRQVTAMIASICAAVVLAPVGAMAATGNLTSIADPVHKSQKARVNASGNLYVTQRDATNGRAAKIDAGGHTIVGDGKGALTVDGRVSVTDGSGALTVDGAIRPLAPAAPFSASGSFTGNDLIYGPTSSTINLTSLTVTATTNDTTFELYMSHVPKSATSCADAQFDVALWMVPDMALHVPLTTSFPTPLQHRAAAGTKLCLFTFSAGVWANVGGFLGT